MPNSLDDPTQKPQQGLRKRSPFSQFPSEWASHPDLSDRAVRLLLILDQQKGEKNKLHAGQKYLQTKLPSWSLRKIQRALAELIDLGIIESRPTWGANVYCFSNPARRSTEYDKSVATEYDKSVALEYDKIVALQYKELLHKELSNKQGADDRVSQPAFTLANALNGVVAGRIPAFSITANKLVEAKAHLIEKQGLNLHELARLAGDYLLTEYGKGKVTDPAGFLLKIALTKAINGELNPDSIAPIYAHQAQLDPVQLPELEDDEPVNHEEVEALLARFRTNQPRVDRFWARENKYRKEPVSE